MPFFNGRPCRALRASFFVIATVFLSIGCEASYEFEPLAVGDDEGEGAPKPITNDQFVRSAFADVLGRSPEVYDYSIEDAAGVELYSFPIREQMALVGALDGMGDPAPMRALLCAGLLGSAEATIPTKSSIADPSAFIRAEFRTLLGREPNVYEARAFEDAWRTDEATGPRVVIRAIVESREYQSR